MTAVENEKAAAETSMTEAEAAAAEEKRLREEAYSEKEKMENSLAAERARANEAVLALAVRDGKILKPEVEAWKAKLTGEGREAAMNGLAAMKPRLNTQALGGGQDRADREKAGELREQVANAVTKLQDGGMSYLDAWREVKGKPEFASYFV